MSSPQHNNQSSPSPLEQDVMIHYLFYERPRQYGLRGDPKLWDEMEKYFLNQPMPANSSALIGAFETAFLKLVGMPVSPGKVYVVKRYVGHDQDAHGAVSSDFWLKSGFPLLKSRYEDHMNEKQRATTHANLAKKMIDDPSNLRKYYNLWLMTRPAWTPYSS